ncbi:DNA-binding transcriptional regulator, AcrR family [Amycolatopsis sacchari]|uniref:DNA-binding transcriptional regulator, AcrR family n=1 Tax=Amycolatopsis sacchari TaxID=115433 RepID=A0A1I3YE62_9PSEU|nr:TetR/AcrR family transcriptional regulator [Amycolatopsis sacchari]SFK29466.1 DNA-binding transcriptional regulator, AcrR family [Amycolatopsis sacchari]
MPPRLTREREDEILAVAFELMMEQGLDRVTIDAVAARAGASKATLYRRWPSKDELFIAAVQRLGRDAFRVPDEGSFREDVLAALRNSARWLAENRAVVQFLIYASRREPALERELQRQVAEPHDAVWLTLIERWRGREGMRPGIDLGWLHRVCEGLFTSQLLPNEPALSDDYLVRFTDEIVLPLFTVS